VNGENRQDAQGASGAGAVPKGAALERPLRRAVPLPVDRRRFLKLAFGAAVAAPPLAAGYAVGLEPHWVQYRRVRLPLPGLPSSLDGATLVQFSDLHVGPRVSDDYLRGVFRAVARLKPDLVAVTGDFISYDGGACLGQLTEVLRDFPRGRLGGFAVLGNHDYGLGWREADVAAEVTARASAAGLRVLRNEVADIGGLRLVGLDDLWARHCLPGRCRAALDAPGPCLALAHNPDTADTEGWGRFRGWILSGHTHGGQCRPPFLPPPLLPVKNRRYVAGEVPLADGRRLYINRGLGHLARARFGVRPEVTLFTLRAA